MRNIDKYTLLPDACRMMKFAANKGIWDGKDRTPYFDSCIWFIEQFPATAIFTKECGYHSGGWWKNPDYERCYHLSLSFKGGNEKKALDRILTFLFGEYKKWLWIEAPYSEAGKKNDVYHYRLFYDENWQPIKPRGEVYDTHFTEIGWKSFSAL